MAADPLRLLHRHSAHGYTDRLDKAMHNEPEAVSAETQAQLSSEARQKALGEFKQRLAIERGRIEASLQNLEAHPDARRFRQDIGAVRAALDRIRRAL